MAELLSVDNIAFTFLGYPMSYIELVGTVLYLWSVWLISKKNMLTWPVGIVSVLLYMALFYQIRLYADTFEQVYYLGASIYGWWWWHRSLENASDISLNFRYSSRRIIVIIVVITLVLSLIAGVFISRLHILFPLLFPEAASFPYLDALTTVMSFVAMWFMARKRIESWYYWIVVDVIGIWLYYVKEVHFISLLYVILLAMAINGLLTWNRTSQATRIDLSAAASS
jgi:nicotinamide mononucleotide transporter